MLYRLDLTVIQYRLDLTVLHSILNVYTFYFTVYYLNSELYLTPVYIYTQNSESGIVYSLDKGKSSISLTLNSTSINQVFKIQN